MLSSRGTKPLPLSYLSVYRKASSKRAYIPLSLSLSLPPFLLFIVSFDGRRLRARSEVFVHGHPVDDGTSRGSVKNPHATVTANTG